MILAIDIGNTNIVLGCIDDGKILFSERISTDIYKTELEYATTFKVLFDMYNIDFKSLTGAVLSSVVPPINGVIIKAVNKLLNIDVLVVGPGVKTELNILMDNPAQVGADLIVNAVAGLKLYGAPLIMIDMGTATTISVLDENRRYIGGMIVPGVMVSLNSLVDETSQLPRISIGKPKKVLGRNTIDSMKSGIVYSQAASIDGIIDRIEDELGYSCPIVATGGMAKEIIPFCKKEIEINGDLTLIGLEIIFNKNNKQA